EHKVGDQTHYWQGTEEPVVNSPPILEDERQCQRGRDRPKQNVLCPLTTIIRKKGKNQQDIENCERRQNCQQGGARETRTGNIRLLRTVNEFWHSGVTLSVQKLQRRISPIGTRANAEVDRSRPSSPTSAKHLEVYFATLASVVSTSEGLTSR